MEGKRTVTFRSKVTLEDFSTLFSFLHFTYHKEPNAIKPMSKLGKTLFKFKTILDDYLRRTNEVNGPITLIVEIEEGE